MAKNTVLVIKTGKTTYLPLTDDIDQIEQIGRKLKLPQIKSEHVKEFNIKEDKLTELEWFKLELIGEDLNIIQPYIDAACEKIDNERISELDLKQIKGMAIVETTGLPRESKIIACCIGAGLRFDRKTLLEFGVNGVSVEERTKGIEIPEAVHVVFENGKLYFKGFNYLSSLFTGVDKYFREVTDGDVDSFCSLPMFLFGEEFDANLISKRQRKQISLSIPIIPDFNDGDIRKKFTNYAKDYLLTNDSERLVKGDRFAINSAVDLSLVFHLIYADYFTNEITGEKMIAKRSEKLRF
jgi:hypothetical protein